MRPLPTTPESLLPLVLAAFAETPDARLRQLLASLTTHLHSFVLEHQVSQAEFERAVAFLVGIGQATGETKNEVILAADLLGVSTLVALLNNPGAGGHDSDAALLGPFWRANAPVLEAGASIACDSTAGVALEVSGTVADAEGRPLAGAEVDVWQASPVGLYENQDPQQPEMNLRGRFRTDAEGRYRFRTVFPAGYPVPTDGPCGELLRAQRRHPFRPAHLHFMVSKPGCKVLITQVFPENTEYLDSDPVFGVTTALVGRFEAASGPLPARLRRDFTLAPGETVFPHPPIP
ncbi:dioxygenase [Aquabacterium sp.]|uniref:dioxygenase family protein n=1 Tax=Aquabacterium sp. TaxID=1872578 RepID=UPI002CAC69B6|nr:dioxygenase [Aquabacterium sp.]HSW05145.1 dioxygenase [Aquabacterium sp.]